MDKVFVSYSHADSSFADRLVSDLRLADIPVTYDRWVLNVGDSIISRISEEVSAADRVIALLSQASIGSNWVRKELALAMTGELASAGVKVLPALIEDCAVPDMLLDKFYADFRHEYHTGMQALMRALLPDGLRYDRANKWLQDLKKVEIAKKQYGKLLQSGDKDAIHNWLRNNDLVLAGLLEHTWRGFGIVPRPPTDIGKIDFAIINGQSGRCTVSLVYLGEMHWKDKVSVQKESDRLVDIIRWCRNNIQAFTHHLAMKIMSEALIRRTSTYAAARELERARHIELNVKAFIGRRSDYSAEENMLRNQIYGATNHAVDIMSYDRVIDILDHITNRA
jgi:hypothetical protein